jgi:tRNA pseudouridine55 synthase
MATQGAILNVLKPPGMTSHDVIDAVRAMARMKRVGHAGTLDPAAAGVLLVMTGARARLSPYLMAYDKKYRVEVTFGVATNTGDPQGEVVEQQDASGVSEAVVAEAAGALRGVILMKPHKFSAAKIHGEKAYDIARRGDEPDLAERAVVLHQVRLVRFDGGERPRALIEIHCGKGTYVRSLAEMIARRVGTCGHASFVLRTDVGPISVRDARTIEELGELAERGELEAASMPVEEALAGYPRAQVTADQIRMLAHGTAVPTSAGGRLGDIVAVYDEGGELVGMAEIRGAQPQVMQPRVVLRKGE